MKVSEIHSTGVLAQHPDVAMYKFPITPEHTDVLSNIGADDLTVRIFLQREKTGFRCHKVRWMPSAWKWRI